MLGQIVGNYQIVDKLGEGGMGVVYVAQHTLIGRRVAVKVLLPELSVNQDMVNRFFNEARATALIKHPGLVDIFDYGYHASGRAYIAMELLEGENLKDRLERGGVPLNTALHVTRQMAKAVGAAHDKGIVHRDLKPDNVFLVADADVVGGMRVKVLDFGIAKLAGDPTARSMMQTRTGSVLGTPTYMSPEQCRGAGQVDHRADIYSLGCILFEMVCGRLPFVGEGPGDIIAAHLREPAPWPRSINPAVPPRLEIVILRALSKRPEERQQTMTELVAELDAVGVPGLVSGSTPPPFGGLVGDITTLGTGSGQVGARSLVRGPRRRWLLPGAIALAAGAAVAIGVASGGGGGGHADKATVTPAKDPEPEVTPAPQAPPLQRPAASAPAPVVTAEVLQPAGSGPPDAGVQVAPPPAAPASTSAPPPPAPSPPPKVKPRPKVVPAAAPGTPKKKIKDGTLDPFADP